MYSFSSTITIFILKKEINIQETQQNNTSSRNTEIGEFYRQKLESSKELIKNGKKHIIGVQNEWKQKGQAHFPVVLKQLIYQIISKDLQFLTEIQIPTEWNTFY